MMSLMVCWALGMATEQFSTPAVASWTVDRASADSVSSVLMDEAAVEPAWVVGMLAVVVVDWLVAGATVLVEAALWLLEPERPMA